MSAKIYLDGKTRGLRVTTDVDALTDQLESGAAVITAGMEDGSPVAIPRERVVDVVGQAPEPEYAVQEGIFYGRKVEILSMSSYRSRYATEVWERMSEYPAEAIVVYAEDLGGTVVLVMSPDASAVLWTNPASHADATKRQAQAVRLLAESETIEVTVGEGAPRDDVASDDVAMMRDGTDEDRTADEAPAA